MVVDVCAHLTREGLARCQCGRLMANQLTRQGYRLMAIALLLGLQTYLRLGEMVNLCKPDLIDAKRGVLGSWSFLRLSTRKKPPDKNRNLGRQCTLGLLVPELDGSTVAASRKWSKGRQTVALGAPGIRNAIPRSCRHFGNQKHNAIPKCVTRNRSSTSANNAGLWTQ